MTKEVESLEETTADLPAHVDYEADARAKGWKPKAEFDGDPEDWAPAKTWLKTGDILDTVHTLKREAKQHKELLDHLVDQNKRIAEVTRDKTIAELRQKQIHAAEVGDTKKVSAITDELIKAVNSPASGETDLFADAKAFTKRNASWWNNPSAKTKAMVEYSKNRELELSKDNRDIGSKELFKLLDADVRRTFPDHFIGEEIHAGAEAPSPTASRRKSDPKLSDLSSHHQAMYKSLTKFSKGITLSDYIKQLRESGAIE